MCLVVQVLGPDRYSLQLGPKGECSAPCGGGTRQRSMACVDSAVGLPVELTRCSTQNATLLSQLTEPCNTQK